MSNAVVQEDKLGLYVNHENYKVRPIAPEVYYGHLRGEQNPAREELEKSSGTKICWDGETSMKKGEEVHVRFLTSTSLCTINSLTKPTKETWFIHYSE
jgi:hypothetical protein